MEYEIRFDSLGKVTEKAFQIFIDNETFWFPKSCAKAMGNKVDGEYVDYKAIIPFWLAKKNGFFNTTHNGEPLYIISANK